MNKQLPIIVKFYVKEEQLEYTINELNKIIKETRKEDGCLQYDLHQDINNPNILMFYEVWETKKHWEAHDKTKHIEEFRVSTKDCFDKVEMNLLKHM